MSIDDLIARKQLEDWEKDRPRAGSCFSLDQDPNFEYFSTADFDTPNKYYGRIVKPHRLGDFPVISEGRDAKLRCLFTLRNLNYARGL